MAMVGQHEQGDLGAVRLGIAPVLHRAHGAIGRRQRQPRLRRIEAAVVEADVRLRAPEQGDVGAQLRQHHPGQRLHRVLEPGDVGNGGRRRRPQPLREQPGRVALGIGRVPAEAAQRLRPGMRQEGLPGRAGRDHRQASPGRRQDLAEAGPLQRGGGARRQQPQVGHAAGPEQPVRGRARASKRVLAVSPCAAGRQPVTSEAVATRVSLGKTLRAWAKRVPVAASAASRGIRAGGDEVGAEAVEQDQDGAHARHPSELGRRRTVSIPKIDPSSRRCGRRR